MVRPDTVVVGGTDVATETADGSEAWPRAIRLAVAARARATCSTEHVWMQVRVLEKIVPGLATDSLLAKGPNASSVILASPPTRTPPSVAPCVPALRRAFPTANVARIAGRAPGVLAMSRAT